MPAPSRQTIEKTNNKTEETTMTENNFWDDPAVRPAASTWVKFEQVGDTGGGTIAKFSKRTFGAGTPDEKTSPELSFEPVGGEPVPTLTAGQSLLQQALWEMRPSIGDNIQITLVQVQKIGQKTLKRFRVVLTRTNGEVETIDQSEA